MQERQSITYSAHRCHDPSPGVIVETHLVSAALSSLATEGLVSLSQRDGIFAVVAIGIHGSLRVIGER